MKSPKDELTLINLCKQNNARAQMKLYDKYSYAMFCVAQRYVNDKFVAEDLMQESFLKAFSNLNQFNFTHAFGAWVKKIVINNALDWLKQKKLNVESFDLHEHLLEQPERNLVLTDNQNDIKTIYKAINELPKKYSLVLKLFLIEGYDHGEISQIINISQVASRTLLHRGKEKLIQQLKMKKLCMN